MNSTVLTWGDPRLPSRFWEKAHIDGDHWLWHALLWSNGYGRFQMNGADHRVHRLSYTLSYGEPKFLVLHHCDIPSCFRPQCLYDGTQQQNMRDRTVRGRAPSGERNGRAKLTRDQVTHIQDLYATGAHKQKDLASRFGVSQALISQIVRRVTWQDVVG